MSTVFNRVFAYHKRSGIPLLTHAKRLELGSVVAKAFYDAGNKGHITRVEKQEPEGVFKVLYYPKHFTPQMDAIISKFYQDNPPVKRKRKPIPHRPVAVRSFKAPTNVV